MKSWEIAKDWWNEFFVFSPTVDEELVDFLSSLELFENLSASQQQLLSQLLHERQYKKGEVIFAEGDPASAVYLLQEGEVKVIKGEGEEGENKLEELEASDSLGELALCYDHRRTATARTQTPTTIQIIFRQEFMKFSRRHPRCALKVMLNFSNRLGDWLHEANEKNLCLHQEIRELKAKDGTNGE